MGTSPVANRSVQEKPLSIAGRKFEHGVGTHAASACGLTSRSGTKRFTAWVGVDDEMGTSPASVEFRVVADDEIAVPQRRHEGGGCGQASGRRFDGQEDA